MSEEGRTTSTGRLTDTKLDEGGVEFCVSNSWARGSLSDTDVTHKTQNTRLVLHTGSLRCSLASTLGLVDYSTYYSGVVDFSS
jgi:hypothetical protein